MVKIVRKSEIFRKIPEIADVHNFRTEYARNMKFVSKCVVWIFYRILLITQFRPKVDLGPFGNELFKIYRNTRIDQGHPFTHTNQSKSCLVQSFISTLSVTLY